MRRKQVRKTKNHFWKVSVWDDKLAAYIVKVCSITSEKKAEAVAASLEAEGFITSITPHIK